jgi:holo-[acyl-carrier protein] synthase
MIIAIGNDLMEVPRMRSALDRLGARFERRIFTQAESAYCRRRYNFAESFAARFAAKEAVMKALGTGWRKGVRWVDIEVSRAPGAAPALVLHGAAADHAARLGIRTFLVTLTHTSQLAEAFVVAVGEETRP